MDLFRRSSLVARRLSLAQEENGFGFDGNWGFGYCKVCCFWGDIMSLFVKL